MSLPEILVNFRQTLRKVMETGNETEMNDMQNLTEIL
jgi:hypothetical protein